MTDGTWPPGMSTLDRARSLGTLGCKYLPPKCFIVCKHHLPLKKSSMAAQRPFSITWIMGSYRGSPWFRSVETYTCLHNGRNTPRDLPDKLARCQIWYAKPHRYRRAHAA